MTIHFDTINGKIDLKTDDLDAKGRPILEYELNKLTGHIVETKRHQDGSETTKREKDIDISTLSNNIPNFVPKV